MEEKNYSFKEVSFIILVWFVFIIVPYIISYFGEDYKRLLCDFWWGYAILMLTTIFYTLYPKQVRNFWCRIFCKKIDDVVGDVFVAAPYSDENDIKKLKKQVKEISVENKNVQSKIISKNDVDERIASLSKDFDNKKYEKVLLDASRMLSTENLPDKIMYKCRALMELAYANMSYSQYSMNDRIENLKVLVSLYQYSGKDLLADFYLALSHCYLFQNEIDISLEMTYELSHKIKQKEVNSSSGVLAFLYYMQTRIFIMQDKIIPAIISAQEGLKYANTRLDSVLNYLIACCYLYYLNDISKAKYFALQSWNTISDDDDHMEILANLCYISMFFDGDKEGALSFLENYQNSEKINVYNGNLSYLLYQNGKYYEAEKCAKSTLAQQQDFIAAQNTLAMLALRNKNYERAIYLFSEILPSFESDKKSSIGRFFYAEILYNRGCCYFFMGNNEKANDDIQKAINCGFENININIYEELQYRIRHNQ